MDDKITILAKTNFRGAERTFGIKSKDRRQHTYIIGKSGTGKTVLSYNMALQDIQNGHGVCVVDPHGEFVEDLVDQIPAHRVNDVVYFNPADTDYPIGFNVLQVRDEKYKHLVASDLMGIFTKIWANVWSARMEYILNNCILALVETPGTTLLGIIRILVDKDYRQKIINNVKDPVVRSFWVNEYEEWRDQFRNEAIAPIQNKVGQFLSTALIRNIVGQAKSTINIADLMNQGKILLVNVSKGKIGEDNSSLLGAMIITKIQLAAMERVRIPEEERKDFYLYVDEFQNFATESFAGILSEARKYRLNLILAHQFIGQLMSENTILIRDAVFGNVGTLIAFRVGATDAEFLEKEFFPYFVIRDLVNLDNFNVYLKMMIDGVSSRPFSAVTLPPMKLGQESQRDKIIKASRERYANSRKDVEDKISRWSGAMPEDLKAGSYVKTSQPSQPAGDSSKLKETFKANCWACGKETDLNFNPDPSRPVYCNDCFAKKKAGEQLSLSHRPIKQTQSEKIGQRDALSSLGIEYEPSSSDRTPRPESRRQDPRPARQTQRPAEIKRPTPSPRMARPAMSLDKAIRKEPVSFKRSRKEVNLEDLRNTLKEVMGDQKNDKKEPK